MTQKFLGMSVGFPEKSADVRLAQYETGTRTPKADLTAELAKVLDVSPMALDVPNIDSHLGLMHTLFTLEDVYEPYLMQLGFLKRTPRGRCVTQRAYEHLHMKAPGGNDIPEQLSL